MDHNMDDLILDFIKSLLEHYQICKDNDMNVSDQKLFLIEFVNEYITDVL